MATDGFIGRWSRRKLKEDESPEPRSPSTSQSTPQKIATPLAGADSPTTDGKAVAAPRHPDAASALSDSPEASQAPQPTLQDAQALTPESDFKPYLNKGVEPQVRNAAMKKLFADPRYNVMDRLDTYIDDYSQPDPIPESMLRKMVSAQFLGLFDEKEKPPTAPPLRADADTPALQSVAESPPVQQGQAPTDPALHPADTSDANQTAHDHTDLRLQPDDAPGAEEPGGGAG